MATQKSTVYRTNSAEEDTHPHACTEGTVFLTYTVFDEEIGDEVEHIEAVPCRRCAARGGELHTCDVKGGRQTGAGWALPSTPR
jgi:hypothetical protein